MRDIRPQLAFAIVVTALFAYAVLDLQRWSFLAWRFPLGVAIAALPAALFVAAVIWRGSRASSVIFDTESETAPGVTALGRYLLWIAALLAASDYSAS